MMLVLATCKWQCDGEQSEKMEELLKQSMVLPESMIAEAHF